METSNSIIVSGKGGGSEPDPYVPVEDENSLRSNTIARIIDVLGEGKISPANDDNWYKSTYLNETQVMSDDDTMNFSGVTIVGRNGTPDQEYLTGHDKVEAETLMGPIQITESGGPALFTNSNSEIDDLKITLQFPALVVQQDDGDLRETEVEYQITITPDNGDGTEQVVVDNVLTGKCMSTYRKQHLIENIAQFGALPWVIKVYRITEDSTQSKLQNETYLYSYTEIINVKLRYSDTAVVGLTIDASLFGDSVPSRAYKIKGREIQYPSNYDPTTRIYTGIWDGTFSIGYCNNPAWVIYDLIINNRFGIGLDFEYVDKWELYTIAQYCDGSVTYNERSRNPDGSFSTTEITEPRFQFNGVLQDRNQALAVLNHFSSVFMGFPIWTTGIVSFVQDSPKTISRIANPANVENGFFDYSGTKKQDRTTIINVSYNDMTNFCRPDVIPEMDNDAIIQYGYNAIDIVAFACTSPYEALRRAKSTLHTNLQLTDGVAFVGGKEWADVLPGEIIGIQDPNYANINLSGRIADSTKTSITADQDIIIEPGITYTAMLPSLNSKDVYERVLTNIPETTKILTWSEDIDPKPGKTLPFIISSSSVAIRTFEILSSKEKDGIKYEISGIEYDNNKYALIEQDLVIDEPPTTNAKGGKLKEPSNISIQPYTYPDGDLDVRKYGMVISWEAPDDPRVSGYEVIASYNNGGFYSIGFPTAQTSLTYKDIQNGSYDFGIRAIGISTPSNYIYFYDFQMGTEVDAPAPPTNLRCVDDPINDYFTGPDCEIFWANSMGSDYTIPSDPENDIPFQGSESIGESNIKGYKIQVLDGLSVVRTEYTEGRSILSFSYTLAMNAEDNGGPLRNINFNVWTVDVRDQLSLTYASLSASNPAPTMATITPTILNNAAHLDISWTIISDNDMDAYEIKVDDVRQGIVAHPQTDFRFSDVEVGTTYTIQIIPWDKFGPGVGSQTNTGSPVKIPAINIDVELSGSIEMSDSDDNTPAELNKLYDGVEGANGVSYTLSGTDKWIEYEFGLEDYFDRVGVWAADTNGQIYIALSINGTDWTYLQADPDHTLDATGEMTIVTNQSEAQTNYLQMTEIGLNLAMFPNNLTAKFVRLYLTGTYITELYEYVPSRILISEMAAIKYLSVLSQDVGLLTAGMIRSANGNTYFDLDNNVLVIGFASGYSNISDKPSNLSAINSGEGNKLGGIASGADVTGSNVAASITGQGGLATKSSVDLSSEVTNKSLANLDSTANSKLGGIDEGADVTANHKAADTTLLNGTAPGAVAYLANIGLTNLNSTLISGGKIATGLVTALSIQVNTITALQMAANSISTDELAANSITATKGQISDLAVTEAKIANLAVTGAKIEDLTVTNVKIIGDAELNGNKISIAATGTWSVTGGTNFKTTTINHSLGRMPIVQAYGSVFVPTVLVATNTSFTLMCVDTDGGPRSSTVYWVYM